MRALFTRLRADEDGQDQIEYALLTVMVALLGVASADLIRLAIIFVYASWVGGTDNLWVTPDPS